MLHGSILAGKFAYRHGQWRLASGQP